MIKFDEKYNSEDFLQFLHDFLPADFIEKEEDIVINKSRYKEITNAKILGYSESLDLYVLEMDHTRENDPRITIATDAFKILADHWIHKSLIIFKSKESDNYRLSYLTISLDLNEKNKAVKKYSNARRYSFYLGSNAKINTPTKYLINKGRVVDSNDLKSRFSLEVVNKDFYREISELFIKLVGGTAVKGKSKLKHSSLLKLPSIQDKSQTSLEFAVRLIGRIIFCWFLREKHSQKGQSLMPKELLSLEAVIGGSDYYHKILEPIFFEVLNKPIKSRKESYAINQFASIPYLNGGLFAPHEDDYFSYNEDKQAVNHNIVVVPDKWLLELFTVLETYNFTIDENISFDEELSIDPEMLGRIFENLLAEINPETGESARKSTGSYYTPRAIVEYMVDESMCSYLQAQTTINENKLRSIISYDFSDNENEILSEEEKNTIIDALERVKILDPACGSGAFPIGALQKIVFILQQVDTEGHIWFSKQLKNASPEIKRVIEREFKNRNFDYIRKLGVIRENIYGVDIQPIATEISRLRCFLTLIVDESIHDDLENRGIEPLPNLDFKFVTANSIVGLPDNQQTTLFNDKSGIDQLKDLREQFFNSTNSERQQLKLDFKNIQNQMLSRMLKMKGGDDITHKLSMWDPFSAEPSLWFDPEWMFGIKEGFDIVIANPPYINVEKLDGDFRKYIFKNYKTCAGRTDIYIAFLEKSISLLRDNGLISFIIPYAFSNQKYGTKLRELIIKNYSLDQILDLSEYFVFDQAVVKNIVLLVSKKKNTKPTIIKKAECLNDFLNSKLDVHNYSQNLFLDLKDFRLETKNLSGLGEIKTKIYANSLNLDDICFIAYGARINHKIEKISKDNYISLEKTSEDLKPYIEGKNIQRYKISQGGWLKYEPNEHYNPMFKELFESDKIVFINVVKDRLRFALDAKHFYNSHTVVNCVKWDLLSDCKYISVRRNINMEKIENGKSFDYKFLLGLLNSNLIDWYFKSFLSEKLHFYPDDAKSLPIKKVAKEGQKSLIEIVDKILSIIKSEEYLKTPEQQAQLKEYDHQIDQIVYKLYELTPEEIKIVENNIL